MPIESYIAIHLLFFTLTIVAGLLAKLSPMGPIDFKLMVDLIWQAICTICGDSPVQYITLDAVRSRRSIFIKSHCCRGAPFRWIFKWTSGTVRVSLRDMLENA